MSASEEVFKRLLLKVSLGELELLLGGNMKQNLKRNHKNVLTRNVITKMWKNLYSTNIFFMILLQSVKRQ